MTPEFIKDKDLERPDYYKQKLSDIRESHAIASRLRDEAALDGRIDGIRNWQQERERLAHGYAETQKRLLRSIERYG